MAPLEVLRVAVGLFKPVGEVLPERRAHGLRRYEYLRSRHPRGQAHVDLLRVGGTEHVGGRPGKSGQGGAACFRRAGVEGADEAQNRGIEHPWLGKPGPYRLAIEPGGPQLLGHPHIEGLGQAARLRAVAIPNRPGQQRLEERNLQERQAVGAPVGSLGGGGPALLPIGINHILEFAVGGHGVTFFAFERFLRRRRISVAQDFIWA